MQRRFVPGAPLAEEGLHRLACPARGTRALQLFAQLGPRGDELPGVAGIFERVHEPRYCRGALSAACWLGGQCRSAPPYSLNHLVFLLPCTQCFSVTNRLIPG